MIELRDGPAALTIDPDHGGRLASLTVAGRELLVPHSAGVSAIGWGCYLMVPWPGRLRDAEPRLGRPDLPARADARPSRDPRRGLRPALDRRASVRPVGRADLRARARRLAARWDRPPVGRARRERSDSRGRGRRRAIDAGGPRLAPLVPEGRGRGPDRAGLRRGPRDPRAHPDRSADRSARDDRPAQGAGRRPAQARPRLCRRPLAGPRPLAGL